MHVLSGQNTRKCRHKIVGKGGVMLGQNGVQYGKGLIPPLAVGSDNLWRQMETFWRHEQKKE
jgi:hypothetical protein